MRKALYVLHTADDYELPIYVGDAEEMSKFIGCSPGTLYSKVAKRTVDRQFNAMIKRVCEFTGGETWQ